jgi:hypothetical protein
MNTKFTFIFILILSFTLSVVAQDRSVAYVFTKANGGPASQEVNKNLISELSKNYGYDLYFYNYNVEKELTYLPQLNGNKEEKTAKYYETIQLRSIRNIQTGSFGEFGYK